MLIHLKHDQSLAPCLFRAEFFLQRLTSSFLKMSYAADLQNGHNLLAQLSGVLNATQEKAQQAIDAANHAANAANQRADQAEAKQAHSRQVKIGHFVCCAAIEYFCLTFLA